MPRCASAWPLKGAILPRDGAFSADLPSLGLQARFDDEGVEISDGDGAALDIQTTAWGRAGTADSAASDTDASDSDTRSGDSETSSLPPDSDTGRSPKTSPGCGCASAGRTRSFPGLLLLALLPLARRHARARW